MEYDLDADDIMQVREHSDVLVTAGDVQRALAAMAVDIARVCAGKAPLLLCVMNGGLFVTSELARRCDFALQMDYVQVASYGNATTGGELKWLARPQTSVVDRLVVVIDDILDRGRTLAEVVTWCLAAGATQVLSAVLVEKAIATPRAVGADFVGLRCDDRYLYGCGMDYRGYWRNLPAIHAVRPEYLARRS